MAGAMSAFLPYGGLCRVFKKAVFFVNLLCIFILPTQLASAENKTIIAVLGDSLTAGYGLARKQAFPAQLEAALQARGLNVEVRNAGVSGDTAEDGLTRLDWAIGPDIQAVIVELGANDALRGHTPERMRKALSNILSRLRERQLPVLLAGMKAPRNMGPEYAQDYDRIFPELAKEYGIILFPFFLEGVAADASLNLADGMHPNASGVSRIVKNILPYAERLIRQAIMKSEK